MGRAWRNEVPVVGQLAKMAGMQEQSLALWAVVERLEALVTIGDALEEVADLWANTLAFGGQPVGEVSGPGEGVPAWKCDRTKDCVFLKGHEGECLLPLLRHCQCVKPDIAEDGVCANCNFPGGDSDAAKT